MKNPSKTRITWRYLTKDAKKAVELIRGNYLSTMTPQELHDVVDEMVGGFVAKPNGKVVIKGSLLGGWHTKGRLFIIPCNNTMQGI
jgi:hypothetical protein